MLNLAGRTPLTKSIILGSKDLVNYLLQHDVCVKAMNERKDNLYRTSLHYAYCMRDRTPESRVIVDILLDAGADTTAVDVCGQIPEDVSSGRAQKKIISELEMAYGMAMEMHLLKKYKEMYKIITAKKKPTLTKYKKFLKISRNLWYPMSAMPKALVPRGIPLVKGYRDLIFIAIEEKQVDIAKKLVYLGSDCDRKEWVVVYDEIGPVQTLMTPSEYAQHRGQKRLAEYIQERKLGWSKRTVLFHRAITTLNDDRLPVFLQGDKPRSTTVTIQD